MSGCQVWIVKEREAAGHKVWEWQADCGETGTGRTAAKAHLDECRWERPASDPQAELWADLDAQIYEYSRRVTEETVRLLVWNLARKAEELRRAPWSSAADAQRYQDAADIVRENWRDWV